MKNWKVIAWVITAVVLLGAGVGGAVWYSNNYGQDPYYTKIVDEGKKTVDVDSKSGAKYPSYEYTQDGYDKDGKAQEVHFEVHRERPLRKGAYLKVGYNSARDVIIGWEEVGEDEVPAGALDKLK